MMGKKPLDYLSRPLSLLQSIRQQQMACCDHIPVILLPIGSKQTLRFPYFQKYKKKKKKIE